MEYRTLLLTPGPLTTRETVKEAMLEDVCTWDYEYKSLVTGIRKTLLEIAKADDSYTAVLMQGSGTFGVESCITTALDADQDELLVLANGAYGRRIYEIARRTEKSCELLEFGDVNPIDLNQVETYLDEHPHISHVAFVHCETTTGILNDLEGLVALSKKRNKKVIVDAMSSFGGIEMNITELGIDYLISSANKCLEGVPGFSFVICKKKMLEKTKGQANSLALDLYDQYITMEKEHGKFRFTSPTHVILAFEKALQALEEEGGVGRRYIRYKENQTYLVTEMERLGFKCCLQKVLQGPFITTFHYLDQEGFSFEDMYEYLKSHGFIIYPGKVTNLSVFRIGNIGQIYITDIKKLINIMKQYKKELKND